MPEGTLAGNKTYSWQVSAMRNGSAIESALFVFQTPAVSTIDIGGIETTLYEIVMNPSADAHVGTGGIEGGIAWPSSNYGSRTTLAVGVDNAITYNSYINFDIHQNIPPHAEINKAQLELFVAQSSSASHGLTLYNAANDWAENTITWNNQPGTRGDAISSLYEIDTGLLEPIVLTDPVKSWLSYAEPFYGIAFVSDAAAFYPYSREMLEAYRPVLRTEYYFDPTKAQEIATVEVIQTEGTNVFSGEPLQFSATAKDENDNAISDITAFHWQVLPLTGDGSITQDGLFTGTKTGTCLIMASAYGHSGVSSVITIDSGTLDSIVIYPLESQTITLNNPIQFTAQGRDAQGNPISGLDFTWEVSPVESASISDQGIFTATATGTYHVTALNFGISSDLRTVTVMGSELSSLTLSHDGSNTLAIGDEMHFSVVAYDGTGTEITGLSFEWAIEGEGNVAEIDANGVVTGLLEGKFRVKVRCGSVSAVSEEITVYCALPADFSQALPENNAVGVSITPTLQWEESRWATSYDVELLRGGGSSEVVIQTTTTATSYVVPEYLKLDFSSSYTWRIKAKNQCGQTLSDSELGFTTEGMRVSAVLWPSDDATIAVSSRDTNYGTAKNLICRDTISRNRALLRFDLSDLIGREIISAKLQLYLYSKSSTDDGDFYVYVHRVLEEWTEDVVTWNNAPSFAETSTASFIVNRIDAPRVYQIDITDTVLDWASGLENHGIVLMTNDDEDDVAYFSSSENGSAIQRPRLIVEYRGSLDAEGSVGTYLEPTQALSIYEDEKDLAQVDALIVAGGVDIRRRSLLMYDLSALPAEVDNVSAYQCITYRTWGGPDVASNYGTNYQINVYEVTKPWDISDTWSTFGEFGYDAEQVHGTFTIGTGARYDWPDFGISYSCDISTLVEEWRSGETNNGLMLRATNEGPDMRRWFYRNNGQAGTLAPYMLIFYDWIKPPEIIETQPETNEEGVNIFSPIILTFNRKMDRPSVEGAFALSDGASSVLGAFSWSEDSKIVTFTPDEALSGSTEYLITVTTSTTDWTGRPMEQNYQSTFTTMDTVDVPIIGCSNNPLLFDAPSKQANGAEKTITIANIGEGTLEWNVDTDVAWLQISPASGTSVGESDTVTVIANTTEIESGHFTGKISVTDPRAPNSPIIIPVTLKILHAEFSVSERNPVDAFTFSFADRSTGEILSWHWDFGDGQTSTEQNPVHTYAENGSYSVSLRISSENLTDVFTDVVDVGNRYYVDIFADSLTADQFLTNGCGIEEIDGGWRLYCQTRSNYQENRARVLKTLFYDQKIISSASNVHKLIPSDNADAKRRAIKWSLSGKAKNLKYYPIPGYGISAYYSLNYTYRIEFDNIEDNRVSIWTYSTGIFYDPMSDLDDKGILAASCWMPTTRQLTGYTASQMRSIERSYTHNELLSDTSGDDFFNPDGIMISIQGNTCGYSVSASGYALINSDFSVDDPIPSEYWASVSRSTIDFQSDYNIPILSPRLDEVSSFNAISCDSQVILSWKNCTNPYVQGVRIVRKEGTCPTSPTDGEVIYEGNGEIYIDTSVVNGTTYCYKIYSYDGEELYSSGIAATVTPLSGLPPYNPTNFTAEGLDQQVRLNWKNPAYENFSRVRLLRKTGTCPTGPTDQDAVIIYEGTAESLTDQGLTNHVAYCYRLYTVDKDHLYSSGVEATATPVPPRLLVNLVQLAEESASHTLSLESGWNLVSLPVVPQDKAPSTVFSTALDNIVRIGAQNMTYLETDISTESGEWFYPSDIESSQLTRLEPERGYWIETTNPCDVEMSGRIPYSAAVYLLQKWTKVGFLSSSAQPIENAFLNMGSWEDIIDVIWAYRDGTWLKYNTDPSASFLNNLYELQPGSGYEISIEPSYENQIWHYTNSSAGDLTPTREAYASIYTTPDVDIAQVQIDWGDENGWMPLEGNRYHTYSSDGDYIIQVKYGASLTTNSIHIDANDPPEATAENLTIAEDTIGTGDLLAADPDNNSLIFDIVSQGTKGSVEITDAASGAFKYTPYENFNGPDSFTFKVNDGHTDSNVATVEITINPVNDPPVNTEAPSVTGTPHTGEILTASTGTWNDAKDTDVSGSSTIIYAYRWERADDGNGTNALSIDGAASATYTVQQADSVKFLRVVVTATDDGVGEPATQSASASSPWEQVSNTAPVIDQGDSVHVTMDEDGAPIPWTPPTLTVTDVDGDTLTWSVFSNASHGTAQVSGTGPTPTTFIYTPTADFNGEDSFVVQVADGNGGTDTITVNLTIEPVNDPPSFVKGSDQVVDENAGAQTVPNWATNISAGPGNESDQELDFEVTADNNGLFSKLPDVDAQTGDLTYTPAANTSGEALVTVLLRDDGGTEKGGIDAGDPQTFTITVNPQYADIQIQNRVDNLTPGVGDEVTFTVTAANNGPEDTSGVVVLNHLPTGLAYVSHDSGTYNPDTGIWTVGNLANGESVTLTIQCTVSEPGEILSVAAVMDADLRDPDRSNNSSALILNSGSQADLSLIKSVDNEMPLTGESVTFTIVVTNNGVNDATGVVTDILPEGLVYQSSTATQGTYDPATGVWTVGNLSIGMAATLDLTAEVESEREIVNTARVTQMDQIDPDETNNASSVMVNQDTGSHPSVADLAVQKTVSRAGVDVGEDALFTILVKNNGPDDGNNIQVLDLLPEGISFVSAEASQGAYNEANGAWAIGTLAAGAYARLDVRTTVDGTDAVVNTAGVSALDEFDPDTDNDSASVTVSGESADIKVEKTVDKDAPNMEEDVIFAITVINLGPNHATGIQVSDQLTAGIVFKGSTPSQGTYDSATGLWDVGDLANGGSATLVITAQADAGGELTNTATRTDSSPVDRNSGNDADSVTIDVNRPPEIAQGDSVNVTMDEDGNPTPWSAPNVSATDADGHALTWSLSSAPSHGTAEVSGTGASPMTLTYAPAADYNGTDSFVVQVSDGNGGTDTITVNVTIHSVNDSPKILGTIPDQKKDEGADPWTLDLTEYETDVEDSGAGLTWSVSGVNASLFSSVVTDAANDIVTFAPVKDAHGSDEITLTLTDSEGLTAAQQMTVTLVSVNDPPVITGQNPLTTSEETPLTISLADLQVTDPDNAYPGDFTLTVGNGANYSLSGNSITPSLDYNGTITVPVTVNDGENPSSPYDLAVTVSAVNDAPVNTEAPSISGTLLVGQQLTASPGVWNDDKDTNVSGSSTISYAYQWRRADSSAGENASNINGATQSTYTLTTADTGKCIQVVVAATDNGVGTPAQQSALASSSWKGLSNSVPEIDQPGPLMVTMDEDGAPTAWSAPAVTATDPNGDTLTWTALSGPSHGTADVSGTGPSPNTFIYRPSSHYNGTDSFTVQVSDGNGGTDTIAVNVTIEPVNDPPTFTKGSDQVVDENAGGQTVANWATQISAGPENESDQELDFDVTTNNDNLFTELPAINVDGTLSYTPAANASGEALVTVVLRDNGGTEKGGIDASDPQTFTITINPQYADIQIQNRVDNLTPGLEDGVTFTVTAANNGREDASSVVVLNHLPTGLAYVSHDSGTYNPDTGIWTVGNLANGESVTLTIQCTVSEPGEILSVAAVMDADLRDPDRSNNSSALILNSGSQADLSLIKSVDNEMPLTGESVTFTIVVTNNGVNDATGVVVTDILPEGLAYQSSAATQGAYDPATGIWTVGNLSIGTSATLDLTAEVESEGEIVNTARVTQMDQIDPDETNNASSVMVNQDTVSHPSVADLAVQKTVSRAGVDVGEDALFTVLVRNNGPNEGNHVVLEDILPSGMDFISSEASQGTYDDPTGIWSVGTIPVGGYALLNIAVRISGVDLSQNIARIESVDEFNPDPLNDVSAAGINVGAELLVTVPPNAKEGDGKVQGTMNIPGALATDLTVNLTSSDTTEATVPATVIIPTGETSATFDITILDDDLVDGNQKVTITASADGWTSGSDEIDVLDNEQKALSVNVPASATEGVGKVQGTVSIPGALGPDLIVTLTSSDTTEATVPATVTITAGETSATFDIGIVDEDLVDGNQAVTITGSADGWTSGGDDIEVLDDEQQALSVNVPASATEGDGPVQGTVSIPGTLPANLIVNLTSSDTTEATVPATVTLPAGETSTVFNVTIVDDEEKDGTQSVTITASASGWTSGTATIDVRDNDSDDDCPDCSGENPEVHDLTFKDGMDCECVGTSSMTIGPRVTVEKGAKVTFKSPKITVTSGVHAEEGAIVEMRQQ